MQIHAIQTGTVAIKTRQMRGKGTGIARNLRVLFDRGWTEYLPIYAWVIEHPEGLIVVDTGETARTSEADFFPRWHPFFRTCARIAVTKDQEIGPQMRAVGLSPEDVRWVVLTHLHTDHSDGMQYFPKSEVMIHRPEYAVASGKLGTVRGYLANKWPTSLSPRLFDFPAEQFGPFSKSLALTNAKDVILVATEGHTSGHISVIVREAENSLFIAGDTSYTQSLLVEQAIDGVAPKDKPALETLQRIALYARENPTVYLPSHDPESVSRLKTRTVVPIG